MGPFFWYFVTVGFAILYGSRIQARIGYVPLLWHWPTAMALIVGVCGGALAVAYTDVMIHHDVGIGLHSITLFIAAWLGIRYWFPLTLRWGLFAAGIAFGVVESYLWQPAIFNNIVLSIIALGIGVAGYFGTKQWLRVLIGGLCLFDVYAVWFSDTMNLVIEKNPGAFPATFVMATSLLATLEIGALDVIITALLIIGVHRHRGALRAVFCGLLSVGALSALPIATAVLPAWFGQFPFMLALAPIAFWGLSGAKSRSSSAC